MASRQVGQQIRQVTEKRTAWDSEDARSRRQERAAERMRLANKAAEAAVVKADLDELQRRYRADPDAVLAEYTRVCPYCERSMLPLVFECPAARSWPPAWALELAPQARRRTGDIPASLTIHERERCGCPQEEAALEAEAARRARRNEEFEADQWSRTLERAGLVGWLATASFDSWEGDGYKTAVLRWTRRALREELGDTPWLVLWGPYGLGKSHLAAAAVREALQFGWARCYFRPWYAYLQRLRLSFDEDAEERTINIVREMAGGQLVVFDDVDGSPPSRTGWPEAELFNAMNIRYNTMLPTIFTLNRSPADPTLVPLLQPGGVDRLLGAARGNILEFIGTSRRSGVGW